MVSCCPTGADVPTVTPLNLGFCTLVAQLGLPLLHPVDGSPGSQEGASGDKYLST